MDSAYDLKQNLRFASFRMQQFRNQALYLLSIMEQSTAHCGNSTFVSCMITFLKL